MQALLAPSRREPITITRGKGPTDITLQSNRAWSDIRSHAVLAHFRRGRGSIHHGPAISMQFRQFGAAVSDNAGSPELHPGSKAEPQSRECISGRRCLCSAIQACPFCSCRVGPHRLEQFSSCLVPEKSWCRLWGPWLGCSVAFAFDFSGFWAPIILQLSPRVSEQPRWRCGLAFGFLVWVAGTINSRAQYFPESYPPTPQNKSQRSS